MNRFKITGLSLMFLGVIAVLISGCATVPTVPTAPPTPTDPRMIEADHWVSVKVNSITAPDASSKGKTYIITSAMQNVSDNDLEFQEFAKYIENALSQKGYKRVGSKEIADLFIRLAYGIGSPKTETSTRTYTTSGGYSYPVGWTWIHVPPTTETVRNSTTTYARFLILEAYDSKDRRSQLWKTTLKSEGSSSDLRIVLAYMVAAVTPHFGTNTGKQIDIKILGHDPRVLDIWK